METDKGVKPKRKPILLTIILLFVWGFLSYRALVIVIPSLIPEVFAGAFILLIGLICLLIVAPRWCNSMNRPVPRALKPTKTKMICLALLTAWAMSGCKYEDFDDYIISVYIYGIAVLLFSGICLIIKKDKKGWWIMAAVLIIITVGFVLFIVNVAPM